MPIPQRCTARKIPVQIAFSLWWVTDNQALLGRPPLQRDATTNQKNHCFGFSNWSRGHSDGTLKGQRGKDQRKACVNFSCVVTSFFLELIFFSKRFAYRVPGFRSTKLAKRDFVFKKDFKGNAFSTPPPQLRARFWKYSFHRNAFSCMPHEG